jgi:hypothetical protein
VLGVLESGWVVRCGIDRLPMGSLAFKVLVTAGLQDR